MVNCIFDITDSSGNGANGFLYISPQNAPVSYSLALADAETIRLTVSGAPVTASLYPAIYLCRFQDNHTNTSFTISLPTSIDGATVNANQYLINQAPFNSGYTVQGAQTATSASYAVTASYALNESAVVSSSYAQTASFALNVPQTSSFAVSASWAPYQVSSSYAQSSSNSTFAQSASFYGGSVTSASYALNATTSSLSINASNANFANNANNAIVAGTATSAVSASYAQTSSFALNVPLTSSFSLVAISSSFANIASFVKNATSSSFSPVQLPDITDNTSAHKVGVKQTNPQYTLDVGGDLGNATSNAYHLGTSGTNSWINSNGGYLGIGTASPSYLFDCAGVGQFQNTLVLQNGIQGTFTQLDTYLNIVLPSAGNSWNCLDEGTGNSLVKVYSNGDGTGWVAVNTNNQSAGAQLTVNGSGYFSNNITASNVLLTALTASTISNAGYTVPTIMAGIVNLSGATGSRVTFNKAFPNTNYVVTFGSSGSTVLQGAFVNGPLTTTGFTASFLTFTGVLMWHAISTT